MPIVRSSRGSFKPEGHDAIRQRLDEAQRTLVPGIRRREGCLHSGAGIDRSANTMVNMSIWRSSAEVRQREPLAPMLALAGAFSALGVTFALPIVDYDIRWEI